jgi:hypothetical protein
MVLDNAGVERPASLLDCAAPAVAYDCFLRGTRRSPWNPHLMSQSMGGACGSAAFADTIAVSRDRWPA